MAKETRSDVDPEMLEPTPHQQSSRGSLDPRKEHELEREDREAIENQNTEFNEEDWLTNRTNDPRVGTHGRKSE